MGIKLLPIDYLTVTQIAKQLGVSRVRVHQLLESYSIPVHTLPTGTFLIARKDAAKIPRKRPTGRRKNTDK